MPITDVFYRAAVGGETMVATHLDFERFVLDHPGHAWELQLGQVREKPPKSAEHSHILDEWASLLYAQIDRTKYRIRANMGRVASSDERHYIPDLFVIPTEYLARLSGQDRSFHSYRNPLPLVVEIWSPSTGAYDINEKLPEYLARGDAEIWRLHPFHRTLTAWRRRADGGYDEIEFTGGTIELHACPASPLISTRSSSPMTNDHHGRRSRP